MNVMYMDCREDSHGLRCSRLADLNGAGEGAAGGDAVVGGGGTQLSTGLADQ